RVSRGDDGQLAIEDLGSANGTFVNDKRIQGPRTLRIGDVIRLGKTVLEVVADARDVPGRSRPSSGAPVRAGTDVDYVLVVTAGSELGRRVTVGDELIIGREAGADGRLSDDQVLSRRHARIARQPGGGLTVEDLGSANGTFVNGKRVHGRHVLEVGDTLRVGSTDLRLTEVALARAPEAPSAPPAPPAAPVPHAEPAVREADRQRRARDLPVGATFAGCRIEGVISHGDMGVVYRAEELALRRPVALKLILPEYSADDRFRERFRRESRIAAAIDHPNVIPIFDAGDEHGVLYIMMRLVEGTDLRALIAAQGNLEPLRAARIVRQVGAALDAAHARGMLHRDVKPSNVLLARRGDHVYLSDFGLAKPASSAEALTRHGTIVARAEYVAPEQILNQRVDARADIYALGCVLFEALTGEAPFANWTEGPQVLAHLEAQRPSPLDLRPDLPPDFDDVVRRAMATDPSERYPSAGDLGQAALVAAGGQRRASAESVVATGEAAGLAQESEEAAEVRKPVSDRSPVMAREQVRAGRLDLVRWAIALAGLVIVAVGMVAALNGIASL
ncbi:MAG: protein kinase, partial [Candidatus Dormibacteraeota bacterium]|nr:protein kinase [Candidatus Dormibacteraeota bacterium]